MKNIFHCCNDDDVGDSSVFKGEINEVFITYDFFKCYFVGKRMPLSLFAMTSFHPA